MTPNTPNRLETIAIGDELLSGIISDTNSSFVARRLMDSGLRLQTQTVIADKVEDIQAQLEQSSKRSDFIICFGGLGPTTDDLTVDTAAAVLGCQAVVYKPALEKMEALYRRNQKSVTPSSLRQVRYPGAATPFDNTAGLAPGFSFRQGKATIFFLPGVPKEMKSMFDGHVLPQILAASGRQGGIMATCYRCLGIWESELQEKMREIESQLPPGAWLGYRTRYPENHLTLYWPSGESLEERKRVEGLIWDKVAPFCYSGGGKECEELIIEKCVQKSLNLVVVESCTGGLVSRRLTAVAGSSQVFWGGLVTYQNNAKKKLLGVEVAGSHAVSQRCANDLAHQALKTSGCGIAAAIVGYAGPTGGSLEDPIGTAYYCVLGPSKIETRVLLSPREREEIQWGFSTHLLCAILKVLET